MAKNLYSQIFFIFYCLFFIVTLSFADNSILKKVEIQYGYPEQSIFVATVNGKEQPASPMLFVANELFERANITWRATAYPAKRLFKNLKNGETNFTILVRASSLVDDFLFSKEPIYSTSLNVYYIGDKPAITEKEDLRGSRVATIRGYSYGKLLKFIDDPKNNITKEVTNTHGSAFRMLQLGRVDYLIDYDSAAHDILLENSIPNLKINKLKKLDIYLVLSKSYPNAKDFMEELEKIVKSIDIDDIVRRSGAKGYNYN